jgi:5-methylcytosine-specific restriction endonuclease McrA
MSCWPYTTQRWQRLRLLKLRQNPLCELCLQVGEIEPATVVDHIVPINKGGDPFPGFDQLMSLCAPCHNQKTRCEQIGEDYTVKGCDVFGRPLDPNHPWNRTPRGWG